MAHEVFISHASADRETAQKVCAGLEAAGIPCWIAPRDVPPGKDYQRAIVEAIRNTRAMVLVLSEAANQSEVVADEVERAHHYGRSIVVLRIREVQPSTGLELSLSRPHWLDAFGRPLEEAVADLVAAVRGVPRQTVGPPARPSRWSGRRWAAVLAVLLVGLGAGWLWRCCFAPVPSLAVLPFQVEGKVPRSLARSGEVLAEVALAELDGQAYRVLSPQRLAAAEAKGQQVQAGGSASEDALEAIGRAAGARYLLTGTVARADPSWYFTARVVDVQEGTLRGTGNVSFDVLRDVTPYVRQALQQAGMRLRTLPASPPRFLSGVDLVDAQAPVQEFAVTLRTEGDKTDYAQGERLVLAVQATRDCYLTLIEMNSAGNLTLLLPNAYRSDTRLRAGEWTRVPTPGTSPFAFTVGEPYGIDVIRAIATPRPLDLRGVTTARMEKETFVSFGNARGIAVTPEPAAQPLGGADLDVLFHPGEWATDTLIIHTHPQQE